MREPKDLPEHDVPRAPHPLSLVVFFAACGLAGTFVSQKVGAQSSTDESSFRDSLKQFTNVYQIVAENYAEPLTGDKPDDVI